jgi:hypothetical protein
VGSYPTFSPLPAVNYFTASAVSFLWHYPSQPSRCREHYAQGLPGSLPNGARTFLGGK